MRLKGILLSLFMLSLNACHQHPSIHAQETIIAPKKSRTGIPYRCDDNDLSRMAWWEKLHDPKLNQLIREALDRNNDLKSALFAIEQARAELKAAQFAWLPTLDASGRAFTARTWNTNLSPTGNLANTSLFSNITNLSLKGYYAGFMPGYSVNILNNIQNVNASKASLAKQQAMVQATKLAIISQVAGSYFMLQSQKAQLRVQQQLITDLKAVRQIEASRYQEGAIDIERVTSLDEELASEGVKIPQIEQVVMQTENTISLLLNKNPGPIHTQPLPEHVEPMIPEHIPASVLKNRPDLMMALDNISLAQAQIGLAYSVFFPTISLTGLAGSVSADLTNILKLTAGFWTAQAAAALKVLNASAVQQVKAAKANYRAIHVDYFQTLRSALIDVDNSLIAAQKAKDAYRFAQATYQAGKKSYSLKSIRYDSGAIDYREVALAKVNLDKYQLQLLQTKAQVLDSMVQVYTALAGGYQLTPPPSFAKNKSRVPSIA